MLFDFNANYLLENERALLKPLTIEDERYLMPFALNEPDTWKYSAISPAGKDGMSRYIQVAIDGREQKNEYPFIVFDKLYNAYAGCTRFYDIQLANKTLQLGYTWYGKNFQGTGLNKNCKLLLLELAFDQLDFERVEFRADNDNSKSIAAMQSIGCTIEGVLRSNMPKSTGGRRDSIVLSIIKNEWHNGLKQALCNKIK